LIRRHAAKRRRRPHRIAATNRPAAHATRRCDPVWPPDRPATQADAVESIGVYTAGLTHVSLKLRVSVSLWLISTETSSKEQSLASRTSQRPQRMILDLDRMLFASQLNPHFILCCSQWVKVRRDSQNGIRFDLHIASPRLFERSCPSAAQLDRALCPNQQRFIRLNSPETARDLVRPKDALRRKLLMTYDRVDEIQREYSNLRAPRILAMNEPASSDHGNAIA